MGMASTIPAACQLIHHRHILVNGRIVDIRSYRCKSRDIISAKDKQNSRTLDSKFSQLFPSCGSAKSFDPSPVPI
ncbi:hypothetical protein ABFS83_06G145700 [Erythranthe nasuta]